MASDLTREEINELAQLVGTRGMDDAAFFTTEKYDESVDAERRKNRKAVAWGMGAVVLGAGVAEGVHLGMDHATDYVNKLHSSWGAVRESLGFRPDGAIPNELPQGEPDGEGVGKAARTLAEQLENNDSADGGDGGGPDGPNGTEAAPDVTDHISTEQYEAMSSVDKGMGGIELFKEMGLSAGDWFEHEEALLKAHPDDFYRMSDGHVGLQHPGKLSEDAMSDIAKRTGMWRK
jgi:hypothetical protein